MSKLFWNNLGFFAFLVTLTSLGIIFIWIGYDMASTSISIKVCDCDCAFQKWSELYQNISCEPCFNETYGLIFPEAICLDDIQMDFPEGYNVQSDNWRNFGRCMVFPNNSTVECVNFSLFPRNLNYSNPSIFDNCVKERMKKPAVGLIVANFVGGILNISIVIGILICICMNCPLSKYQSKKDDSIPLGN